MEQTDSPAKVASNDQLGPLPEPAAMTTRYEVVPPGQGSAMSPVGTLRARGRVAVGYTADQMSAYAAAEVARAVAAERERCADVCEGIAGDNKWSDAATAAEAIRLGPNVGNNRPA